MLAWQNHQKDKDFLFNKGSLRFFDAAQRKTLPKVFQIIMNIRNRKGESTDCDTTVIT